MREKIKRIFNKLLGFFPTSLPQGLTEFEAWSKSIINTYQPPMDERSAVFGLCAMLMRLGPTEARKPKRFFALCLHKGAAAQVAAYVMEDIKNQQKSEQQAAATTNVTSIATGAPVPTPPTTPQEATKPTLVVSNDKPLQN